MPRALIKSLNLLCLKYLKYIFTFLLLSVMLFIGARFIVFKTVIKLQKQEFRQIVLKQQYKAVKQVTVSTNDLYKDVNGLEWKESNKEVVIKNVYYEVLSVTKQNNTYVVNIIEDRMENELFANFFERSESGKDLADHLILVFAMNFILPHTHQIKQNTVCHLEYCNLISQAYLSCFYPETIKPPREKYLA